MGLASYKVPYTGSKGLQRGLITILSPDLRPESVTMTPLSGGFEPAGAIRTDRDLIVSTKQKIRKVDSIQMVCRRRESANQNLGFASRPFVLCGLPIRQPAKGSLMHEQRNGHFVLQATGHPATVCHGGRIVWCRFLLPPSRFENRAEQSLSAARRKCWSRSVCSRVVPSTRG
jgi:hypothetical protein